MKQGIHALFSALLLAAGAFFAQPAGAASFPSEPIKLVVGYPPGGSTDIAARIIADKLEKEIGKPVLVDNRAGASGIVGASTVARATPDGHTLLFAASPEIALVQALGRQINYNPRTDFEPITIIAQVPFMLVIHPDVPAKDLRAFLDYARKNPNKVNFASYGLGTSNHLIGEYFKTHTDTRLVHVPFKGSAPAMTDLLAGRVQMAFDTVPVVLPQVESGKLRALGVATKDRSPLAPNVPTLHEAGLPDFVGGTWFGLYAPAKTPEDVLAYLNRAFVNALKDPDVSQKLHGRGIVPVGSSPAELTAFADSEIKRWSEVVQRAGIKLQ